MISLRDINKEAFEVDRVNVIKNVEFKDFYFDLEHSSSAELFGELEEDEIGVVFVPKCFWNENNHMLDLDLFNDDISSKLKDFEEVDSGTYITSLFTLDAATTYLKSLGFEYNNSICKTLIHSMRD